LLNPISIGCGKFLDPGKFCTPRLSPASDATDVLGEPCVSLLLLGTEILFGDFPDWPIHGDLAFFKEDASCAGLFEKISGV
jgi:hypothetical protein